MKLDFATLAFGYRIRSGGGTPNWATALGQGKGYKINNAPGTNEMLRALMYSAVSPTNISTKIGKGGKLSYGSELNSPIIHAAVFSRVYVNDIFIPDGKFVLLVTRDTARSHVGRLRLKYGPSVAYMDSDHHVYSNEMFYRQVRDKLDLSEDACWFVSELIPDNQDGLILNATIVNKHGVMEYSDTPALHAAWEKIIQPYHGMRRFY